MSGTKKFAIGVALLVIVASGCKSCGDDTNGNNTNNTTNTNNNTNNTTNVVECLTNEPLDLSHVDKDTLVKRGGAGVCYSSGDIRVSDGTLTIEPGVIIKFDENAKVQVDKDGRLDLEGTEEDPIVLTSDREEPGWWQGITFDRSNSVDNVLDWVIIQYAGRDQDAALNFTSCCGDIAKLAVSNTIIEYSSTMGFNATQGAAFAKFENNTIRHNVGGAGFVHASGLRGIGEGNTFVGNDIDVVFTEGAVNDGEDHDWIAIDVPYRVTDEINLADAKVTVGPGTTMEFDEGVRIHVTVDSSLGFMGTEEEPILLTGTEEVRGHWAGLFYERTNFAENQINWTTVEYAGNGQDGAVVALSCCGEPMQIEFSNSTFKESESFGLYLDGPMVQIPKFEGMTLTSNTLGGLSTRAENFHQITEGTFDGNDEDVVELQSGDLSVGDFEWINPGVPFHVADDIVVRTMTNLTIAAGSEFEFASGTRFNIQGGAGISAVGTASAPIVMRGEMDMAGFWQGVLIDRSVWSNNSLQFFEVDNGGGGNSKGNLEISTCCGEATTMALSDITIRSGSKAGLVIPSASTDFTFTGCQNIMISDTATDVDQNGTTLTVADLQALCE